MADAATTADAVNMERPSERYSRYVLAIFVLVFTLNMIDRQILSILAEDVKRDLGLSDAELGFLYGTAFAIFYSLFGIPLGKARGQLEPGASDDNRSCALVRNDGHFRLCEEWRAPRHGADRRGRR